MDIIENESQINNTPQQLPVKLKNKKVLLIVILAIIIISIALVVYIKKKEIQEKISNLQIETLKGLTKEELDILDEPSKKKILRDKQNICDTKLGEEKEECLELLKSLQVTFLEDEKLCEQLDDQKDQCFKNLAINKKNIEICNKVENQDLKQFCMDSIYQYQAQTSGNFELCDKIKENSKKEICIESIFDYIGSVEMCDSEYIIDNNLIDRCKSITLLKKAKLRNDSSVCEEIPLAEYREDCLQSI